MELYDGVIRARDADGPHLFDGASDQGYLDLIEEEVKPWTYMKFPYLQEPRPTGWYRVGPLARLQNCDFIPSPLAEASAASSSPGARRARPRHAGLPLGPHDRGAALRSRSSRHLLDDPDILDGELMATGDARRRRCAPASASSRRRAAR
jgi:NAD-reducing hydrogenase large subunit